jgi:hypothetical protein
MTSNENTLAAVHTFITMVDNRELQKLISISSRMQKAATFLNTTWGSEEQPGKKGAKAYSAKLRDTAVMVAGLPTRTYV